MINLLTDSGARSVKRDYYLRLLAAALFLVGAAFAVNAGFLIPSYILASLKAEELGVRHAQIVASIENTESTDAGRVVADVREKLTTLSESKPPMALRVIEQIIDARPSGIELEEVSFTAKEGGASLGLSGTASTREALTSFKRALERSPGVTNVVLPVSNFAQESDISFSLSLTWTDQTP